MNQKAAWAQARNLVKAGYEVTVWNRTAERCEPAREAGAAVAASVAEAVAASDICFATLSAPDAALAVRSEVAASIRPGSAPPVNPDLHGPERDEHRAQAADRAGPGSLGALTGEVLPCTRGHPRCYALVAVAFLLTLCRYVLCSYYHSASGAFCATGPASPA